MLDGSKDKLGDEEFEGAFETQVGVNEGIALGRGKVDGDWEGSTDGSANSKVKGYITPTWNLFNELGGCNCLELGVA